FSAARECRRRHDRRGHQAVRRLVMLVHRHRVEAELLAVLQLVEIAVVELVALLRVEVLVRQLHPHGAVPAPGLEVEVGVRHQVEQDYLHTKSTNSSTFSACGRWPQFSTILICARGSNRRYSSTNPTGRMRSSRPQISFTGTSMRCSHFGRKGSCRRGSQARRAVVWRFLSASSTSTGADKRAWMSFSSTNRLRTRSSGGIRKMSAGSTPGAAIPAGLTSTSDLRRDVSRTAISIAIHPPMELPTTVTFLRSSRFRKSR